MDENEAYIFSQIACMLTELEAMKAANYQRQVEGKPLIYTAEDFRNLPVAYGVHHNAVLLRLQS